MGIMVSHLLWVMQGLSQTGSFQTPLSLRPDPQPKKSPTSAKTPSVMFSEGWFLERHSKEPFLGLRKNTL